jgi:hypothetical protein
MHEPLMNNCLEWSLMVHYKANISEPYLSYPLNLGTAQPFAEVLQVAKKPYFYTIRFLEVTHLRKSR